MTSLAALKCPSCGADLRAEDVDAGRGFAKCSYCRALITLPTSMTAADFKPRAEVPLPHGITVEDTVDGVEIRRRWFAPHFVFLVFFCIAWNAFLIFWYSLAFAAGAPWIMKVFPLGHVAVGAGMAYYTLAGFLNTTSIRAGNGRLSLAHHPLPWRGNRELDGSAIAQLFCKERVNRNKSGSYLTYELWVTGKDGLSLKLLGSGTDLDQALFLEQRLERALKITDRPVPGEVKR